MADQTPPTGTQAAATGLVISPEVQAKFGELIGFIKASESMNDEERQYWINILPIMTPEQIKNLEEILSNERQQLAAIDAKYAQVTTATGSTAQIASMEQKMHDKKEQRQKIEMQEAEGEQVKEADLMAQIQSL